MKGEIDRIYYAAPSELYLTEVANDRAIKVLKMGFPDAVTCAQLS